MVVFFIAISDNNFAIETAKQNSHNKNAITLINNKFIMAFRTHKHVPL